MPLKVRLSLPVLLIVASACYRPASAAPFDESQEIFTGQNARIVEAVQQSIVKLPLEIERQVQVNSGVWMIVAHATKQPVDSGAIVVELKETGTDDTTVRVRSRVSGAQSREERQTLARTLFDAIRLQLKT